MLSDFNYKETNYLEQFNLVPLDCLWGASPLRIALLTRRKHHSADGIFVLVPTRERFVKAYLGAVIDVDSNVVAWLEICVQSFRKISAPSIKNGLYNNHRLDCEWSSWVELQRSSNQNTFASGFELKTPPPLMIDSGTLTAEVLSPGGNPALLCTDEEMLAGASKEAYRLSLARYISFGADRLVQVINNDGTAVESSLLARKLALPENEGRIIFNPACGRILLRRHNTLSMEELLRLYKGGHVDSLAAVRWKAHCEKAGVHNGTNTELFLSGKPDNTRQMEVLYLKLSLFAEMLSCFIEAEKKAGRPFLDITQDSWRFSLMPARHLPALWTVEPCFCDTPASFGREQLGANIDLAVAACDTDISVYKPDIVGRSACGTLNVRVHNITKVGGGRRVSGTLEGDISLRSFPNPVVRLQWDVAGTELSFFARVTKSKDEAGVLQFVADDVSIAGQQEAVLSDSTGHLFTAVSYDMWPFTGIACDCYSMAVLAMKLFYSSATDLAETLSAFSALGKSARESGDWRKAIRKKLAGSPVLKDGLLDIEGLRALGASGVELWLDIYAVIAMLLPGTVEESVSASACMGSWLPETAVGAALNQAAGTAAKVKMFVVSQWEENRVVRDALNDINLT